MKPAFKVLRHRFQSLYFRKSQWQQEVSDDLNVRTMNLELV